MNNKPSNRDLSGVNTAIRALHDELKSLVLTCAPTFPREVPGGLEFLTEITDLQANVAAYVREVQLRLFQLATRDPKGASPIRNSSEFIRLWEERGKLPMQENRPENDIDAAIRKRVKLVLREMSVLGEEEMRELTSDEDIPKMLYYLSTLEHALSWYAARCLARLTGELAKAEV